MKSRVSAPICLITGVGPGTGTALVKRFSEADYTVAMIARDSQRLHKLSEKIDGAHPYPCDVSCPESLEKTVKHIQQHVGNPAVVIHNAVGGAFGDYMDIDRHILDENFKVNTLALLQLAQLTSPAMIEAGSGVILATGNTSAYRGKSQFAGFAPTKASQRILIESIARSSGPKGIHAAYVAIDAVIDLHWTRSSMPDKDDDFFCKPSDIADQCFQIAHQPKSAWSSEIVIRPYAEQW